ncbi:hypothetical protein JM93_03837 [Roseibium hamelinense]|uniref:histidine kinase n=1 Tax=Roseibium hamelinense TaxID=150831 RepID=A0A562SKR1_9HYPH|nr:response regulator [Roseibium hamelinense]MTI43418.1 response regulator [Roseibium hamelinense]TWI81875.1 hypothetical protein JM93_03837 [Roseibium hamelinense]
MTDHEDADPVTLLAHDLRTPLSAMKLTADLIGAEPLSDRQRERLSLLSDAITSLAAMTTSLIEDGQPGIESRPHAAKTALVLRSAAGLFAPLAEEKGLVFRVDLGSLPHDASVVSAPAVWRVVTTLLDNAIKYTVAGTVTLSARLVEQDGAPADVLIEVSDTGPGIAEIDQARLFRPYVRGSAAQGAIEGAGLGLASALDVAGKMGGQLTLESTEGAGCRFALRVSQVHVCGADTPYLHDDGQSSGAGLQGHVLIVDDNGTNRRLLGALLETFGLTFAEASGGEAALESLRENRFDAVLLDLYMPNISGMEVARKAREVLADQNLPPLIAVTAAIETVSADELKLAGIVQTVSKPLDPANLYAVLKAELNTPR